MTEDLKEEKYQIISLDKVDEECYEIKNDNIGQIEILNIAKDKTKEYKVNLELSKEAMIGFAISAIRCKDGLPEDYDIRIEPLGSSCVNQSMGFFLTPDSPELYFYGKEYGTLNENLINKVCEKKEKNKSKLEVLIDLECEDEFYEIHNIGFNNIARIKVYENEKEITSRCDVIFRLSKNAFLGLGIRLLRMAHKYKEGKSYLSTENDIGFYLTNESPVLEIKCTTLGSAFDYDSTII